MEVTLLLLGNAGDDSVSRGGEGDKDDPIIDPPYTRTEMGQTINFDLGQGSHVHGKKVTAFSLKGK
jgi:hypothetical protein